MKNENVELKQPALTQIEKIIEYDFYSVHYHNRLQIRNIPCHIYKIERRSFQNQVPITAELRVTFRKH